MEIRKIKKLIELLEQSNITEIEIKEGDQSIRLSRQSILPQTMMYEKSRVHIQDAAATISKQHAVEASPIESVPVEPISIGHMIRSPMVGTLYLSASPEVPPFVSPGQKVKTGDTLCIIEAMKMFNEIETDKTGKIIEILVKNGEPVEYDQPLFIIEPIHV